MNGYAAGAGGVWHRGTKTLALARLRLVEWIAFSMVAICDSASGKPGGKLLVENLGTIFLFKGYSVRHKVYSSLSKVRHEDTLPPQPQRGLVMPRSGISSTRSRATVSHRQGSRRSSRRDCR